MLTRDVKLDGFTGADWTRLAEVLRPPDPRPREYTDLDEAAVQAEESRLEDSGRSRGGIVAVVTGGRLRKLLSTRLGRLDIRDEVWPASPHDLAARHSARWAVELETGALDELMERFADRLRPEHDLLAQVLELFSILRELESEGRVHTWPWRLEQWPLPSERMLLRVFDAFCPDGKAVLLGVFDNGDLATCIALRRRGSGFDWVVGPDELRSEMGLTSGDWTRDYRHLARAVESRVAPLAIGCFGEMTTFRRLAADTRPGAWAAAVASRDVILSPVVPALAIPFGIDVGRAALLAVRGLAERLSAVGWREQRTLGLESFLGFDAFALLRKALGRRDTPDQAP